MNEHFGAHPAPEPRPEGLSLAFRAADRRRLRTASLAAAMPVLVMLAMSVAPPFGSNGSAGLQPAAGGATSSASADPSPADESPSGEPGAPAESGTSHETESGETESETQSPEPGTTPEPGEPGEPRRPVDRAGPAQPPADAKPFVVTGDGTSSGRFALTETVTLYFAQATHTGAGDTYGVYVEAVNGSTRGGAIHLPNSWEGQTWEVTHDRTLAPGAYRVWLVGTGATSVEVPMGGADEGLSVRTATPATTAFKEESESFVGGGTVEHRLPFTTTSRAYGLFGGDVTSVSTGVEFVVCVTQPDADCEPDGPKSWGSGVGGGGRGSMGILPSGESRDVLTRATTSVGVRTTLTSWYFLLYLDE